MIGKILKSGSFGSKVDYVTREKHDKKNLYTRHLEDTRKPWTDGRKTQSDNCELRGSGYAEP